MTGDIPFPLLAGDDTADTESNPDGKPTTAAPGGRRTAPKIPTIPTVPGTGTPAQWAAGATSAKPATAPATPTTSSTAPAQTEKPVPPAAGAQPVTANPAPAGATGTTQPEPAAPSATPAARPSATDNKGKPGDTAADGADTAKPAIDPSQVAQVLPQLISPLVSAATSIPGAFFSGLSGLLSPFSSILQSFGQGTPSNPTTNGLPPELTTALQSINSSDAGTDPSIDAYDKDLSGHKTEANDIDSIEKELTTLVQQSGQSTTVNRDKIKQIISSVQSQIQSLGPVAGTVSGQAQIANTIAQGLAQAGAVLAKAQGESGITSAQVQQLASRFSKASGSNKLTSGLSGTPTSSTAGKGTVGTQLAGLTKSSSKEQIAAAILAEAKRRGYSPKAAAAILATALQESGLSPSANGGDQGIGGAYGIFQQGAHYGSDRFDPSKNIFRFFERMERTGGSGAGGNIWQQIVGIQQHDGKWVGTSGDNKYLGEIQSQYSKAVALYNKLAT